MIKIAVITTTRAEYGLLRPLLFSLQKDKEFRLSLIVSGTHLSKEYGNTINEIINDGLPIKEKINILAKKNNTIDINKTIANAITRFARHFADNKYDYVFVDGDRYEMLGVCIAAVNSNIPIIHCGGGATTEGAKDEYWRHAITKLSYLHLVTNDLYRKRIVCMGENPRRVINVGSPGLENIKNAKFKTKKEVEDRVDLILDTKYAVVTYHPIGENKKSVEKEINELVKALDTLKELKLVITKSNADKYNEIINSKFENFAINNARRVSLVSSLGSEYYLSAVKYSDLVIGNSSSGIIETPSFKKPTVNIGDRQKGRLQAINIINCKPDMKSIVTAIKKAMSKSFIKKCKQTKNLYGDGNTSKKIIKAIKKDYNNSINKDKKFYDVKLYEKNQVN